MRWRAAVCLAVLAGLLLVTKGAAPRGRTTSVSRQFIVYCDDKELRSRVAGSLDDIRRMTLEEFGLRSGPLVPIVVVIQRRPTVDAGKRYRPLRWLETPDGGKVQIDLDTGSDLATARLQELVVEAVLLTLKYPPGTPMDVESSRFAWPPAWMVEGISEKISLRDRPPDTGIYAGLLESGRLPEIRDYLAEEPAGMDTVSLGVFRAYGCALIDVLQSQPGGRKMLLDYLKNVPADRDAAIRLLSKTYPRVAGTPESLLKWWTLGLAKFSDQYGHSFLTVKDTEQRLAGLLVLRLRKEAGGKAEEFALGQFAEWMKYPDYQREVAAMRRGVMHLSLNANPLFRPILDGYQQALSRLESGKTKNVAGQLAELEETRVMVARRVEEVADYLNWMEASQGSANSGAFDGYMRLLDAYGQKRPPATEPIGRYLDALETELAE